MKSKREYAAPTVERNVFAEEIIMQSIDNFTDDKEWDLQLIGLEVLK